MKKLYFIFATTLIMLMGNSFNTIAQAPEGFTYQAEARDGAGKLLVNKSLIVKTTILVGSATGDDVWDKNYNVTTDKYGLFSIVVGDAGNETSFSGIDWGTGKYFLNVQIKNGTTWINTGTTQLLSVPYALYAKSAGSAGTESDPVFKSSPAFGITATNANNWNTAYGWGDHAGLYKPIDWVPGWNDVTGKPTFATVATSGNYDDLTNKPTIPTVPTNVSAFTNDAGYLTSFPGLNNFTESNFTFNSRTGVKLQAKNDAQTNVDLVLSSKGYGAILLQQPDGTNLGGNNRGIFAVDLQVVRSTNTQVASGESSFIAGGSSNTASGVMSTAMGSNNTASGTFSTAMGEATVASGQHSVAMGFHTTASNELSFVMGSYTNASGYNSTALGYNSTASNRFAIAMGSYSTASGDISTAIGNETTASGTGSLSTGFGTNAAGNFSTAMGTYTTAPSAYEMVIGRYNTTYTPSSQIDWFSSDRLFVIGNGTDIESKKNALTILKNANTTIGGSLTINGNGTGTSYSFPEGRGTSGQVLKTNADGTTSWAAAGLAEESDPVYLVSPAAGISADNIADWNEAYNWGDHKAGGYLSTETDPVVKAITGLVKSDGTAISAAVAGADYLAPGQAVTTVTGTAPIVSSGGTSPVISINPATNSEAGSMSATDKAKLDAQTTGTAPGQMQYWNGTAWVTVAAGLNGQILKYKKGVPTWTDGNINDLVIGDGYQGGIIAYFLQSGDPGYDANVRHGIIAAPFEQSGSAQWGCNYTPIPGADGIALGTGNQNTMDIEAGCTTSGTAADICANLTLNGYSDWYLPSINELSKLYQNKTAIGGFPNINYNYWSSSEYNYSQAWCLFFGDGRMVDWVKNYAYIHVRAIRSF